jgi:predicted NBD/HSP70 family sugar kinase
MSGEPLYIAIDLGAGLGAKIGLFRDAQNQFDETILPSEKFTDDFDKFVALLLKKVDRAVRKFGRRIEEARAIGIASPGLFRSDGGYLLAANLTFLN